MQATFRNLLLKRTTIELSNRRNKTGSAVAICLDFGDMHDPRDFVPEVRFHQCGSHMVRSILCLQFPSQRNDCPELLRLYLFAAGYTFCGQRGWRSIFR
jgi:hypothetical protein